MGGPAAVPAARRRPHRLLGVDENDGKEPAPPAPVLEEAALRYARAGWPVFPVYGKKPRTSRGFLDATTDEQCIRGWWGAGPTAGIATPTGNGRVVLDVDDCAAVNGLPGELPPTVEALTGGGGRHLWFRCNERVSNSPGRLPGGIHFRGDGGYVVLPPSPHPSGGEYEWRTAPDEHPMAPIPGWLLELLKPSQNGAAPPVSGDIPQNERNDTLTSLAGSMRRRGMLEREILVALQETNKRCRPPLDDREIRRIARSVARYEPQDVPWKQDANEDSRPRFALRQLRESDIAAAEYVWKGRIRRGALSALVGDGGIGKGLTKAWVNARLTRGELEGCYEGQETLVLVIGTTEDSYGDISSRVKAAGGDVSRIYALEAELGHGFEVDRDLAALERLVRAEGFGAVDVEQILDTFSTDSNSHHPQDVRRMLVPLQDLAQRLNVGVYFTAHPSFSSATRGVRAAGSVQFGNVVRSELALGWHPELTDYRLLCRRKGNADKHPPGFVFTVESTTVVNPETGEVVPVGVLSNPVEDPELRWEDVQFAPPREMGETKGDVMERVLRDIGADHEWHSRREAEDACVQEGMSVGTFANKFSRLDFIETEKRGRDNWWRLK
jgi:Bifunctional DNA primase/polymerase, N-terminal/Primase C terminal 1 (PriCT-1)/AAA domain